MCSFIAYHQDRVYRDNAISIFSATKWSFRLPRMSCSGFQIDCSYSYCRQKFQASGKTFGTCRIWYILHKLWFNLQVLCINRVSCLCSIRSAKFSIFSTIHLYFWQKVQSGLLRWLSSDELAHFNCEIEYCLLDTKVLVWVGGLLFISCRSDANAPIIF